MALHVELTRNTLEAGLMFRPRVVNREAMGYEKFLELMAMDTALTTTDMRGVFDRMRTMLEWAIGEGMRVHTPFGSFAAHVKGHANGDPKRPEIRTDNIFLRFRPDNQLVQNIQRRISIVNEEYLQRGRPTITCITDFENNGCLDVVGAGHMVQIRGESLQFDHENPEGEGVRFVRVDEEGYALGEEPMVPDLYTRHGSNRIDCRVPADAPTGMYRLKVLSRKDVHEPGEMAREGTYPTLVEITNE